MPARRIEAPGPFRAKMLQPKSEYELHNGHPVRVAPTGGRGAGPVLDGGRVIAADPAVKRAGIDAGFAPDEMTLRAPDVSVIPEDAGPGWIPGVPPLAVEYADRGQDEDKLREKIADLLERGTRYLWVVRLVGPRRVEVYEPGQPVRTVGPGAELTAPGVLANPILAEALWDPAEADKATLRNLLNRFGYRDVEGIREEGREAGREEGREEGQLVALREAVRLTLASRGILGGEAFAHRLAAESSPDTLARWISRAAVAHRIEELDG